MITEKQLAANRRNALKSTGPRTHEGKAVASKNAVKHGLLSSEILLGNEPKEKFEQFRERLLIDLAPEGELECMLADRIVASAWRLRRAMKIERQMMEYDVATQEDRRTRNRKLDILVGDLDPCSEEKPPITLGMAVSRDLAKSNTYGKFSRYEAPHRARALQGSARASAAAGGQNWSASACSAGSGCGRHGSTAAE